MIQIIKLISLLIILMKSVKTLPLNPNGPIHQEYATSCIMEIVEEQFLDKVKKRGTHKDNKIESDVIFDNRLLTILIGHNMSAAGFGIQSKVIKRINQKQKWSIETLSEQRTEFESGTSCIDNCDTPEENQQIYKTSFQPHFKTQFCFMIVESEEDFLLNFKNFANSKNFNVLAKFLIYIPLITDKYEYIADITLKYLWKQKIFNAAVIIPKNSLTFFNVYSSHVYSYSKICGESPILNLRDQCKRGIIRKHAQLFREKLPRTFKNCSIKAIAIKYPPFVIDEADGFEIKVLNEIGKILHIIFNITFEDAVDWGEKNSSGSWTGLLQEVISESAVAVGNIVAKPDLASDFSLTTQYYEEHMVWVVPRAAEIPLWKNIFIIFKFEVWIVCFVYFILTAILFQIFANRDEVRYFRSFGKNILASLSLLIGLACCVQPKTLMVRTFFILLAVFSMILVILYQSVLMTFLTNHHDEKQISSVEDILSDPEMGIGGMSSFKTIFYEPFDPAAMKIYNMFETYDISNDTAEQWLLTVSIDRDTCTVMSRFYVRYLISQKDRSVVDAHGRTSVFMLKDIVFSYPIRMLLPQGFPLEKKFNRIISYLTNGGIIQNWASEYENKANADHQNETLSEEHEEYGALTLTHFNGAFNLLIFGYIVATVAFLMELIFWKFKVVKKFQNLKVKLKNKCKNL